MCVKVCIFTRECKVRRSVRPVRNVIGRVALVIVAATHGRFFVTPRDCNALKKQKGELNKNYNANAKQRCPNESPKENKATATVLGPVLRFFLVSLPPLSTA